jgi:putative addiction module killer protein
LTAPKKVLSARNRFRFQRHTVSGNSRSVESQPRSPKNQLLSVLLLIGYNSTVIEIRHYVNPVGKDVFDDWLTELADARAQAKIATRINRLAAGNFGDCKSLRQGLYELRVDWGPGYRVYYAMIGKACVLLLCGGDKRKQAADIERALEYLRDYKERRGNS